MLETLAILLIVFQIIILIYFLIANGLYTIFTSLSIRNIIGYFYTTTYINIKKYLNKDFYLPVSIIVPAYNEENTIVANVKALLTLSYPEYELIIVNDGSDDKTLDLLIDHFNLFKIEKLFEYKIKSEPVRNIYISQKHPNLTVVDKENGGKADALNAGINIAKYPIFCSIDADSILEGEALLRVSRPFIEDETVVASGGIVRVLNGCKVEDGVVTKIKAPKKAIECFQAIEYTRAFLAGRTAWNKLGGLLIISGAFGVFKKEIVEKIGGYRKTVGEDMDLVVRLHKYCKENCDKNSQSKQKNKTGKIIFVPDPVCFTQVPSDLISLLNQRNRWHRGLIDSLLFSKTMFLNSKYGSVGMFGFPYFTFIEALGPIVEFLGYLGFILFFMFGILNKEFAVLFFILAILWAMWINIGSVLLDNILYKRYESVKDIIKLCFFGFLEMLGYRQVITIERLIATFQVWKKDWGKPKRQPIKIKKV